MEDDLDRLLKAPLLKPPPDFAEQVFARIQRASAPEPLSRWQSACQWLAFAAAAIPATIQLLAFMSGMWAATAAG